MKLIATVNYYQEHFNKTVGLTIPEYWEVEVTDLPQADCLYGTSQDGERDAINDLIDQLKSKKLTGTLKIAR